MMEIHDNFSSEKCVSHSWGPKSYCHDSYYEINFEFMLVPYQDYHVEVKIFEWSHNGHTIIDMQLLT